MFRRTWLTVDLGRLKRNLDAVRARIPASCRVFAVVKANAYGHGDAVVARALESWGVDTFCVAALDEAAALRRAGIKSDILILSYVGAEGVADLLSMDLIAAVASPAHAKELSEAASAAGKSLRCHLKVNTGMNRIGFDCDTPEQLEAIAAAYALPALRFEGIFSHFSSSDDGSAGAGEYSLSQIEKCERALAFLTDRGIAVGVRHFANSGAIAAYPQAHFDAVRAGALLMGYNTSPDALPLPIAPCGEWKAAVTCIRTVPAGGCVSYSRKFCAETPTRIATVAVGYADGWPRALSNGGHVLLRGKKVPIRGNICMDQMMVDITDVPEAAVGDAVTLIGRDGDLDWTADDVALEAGSCMHEILSRIGLRVERLYEGNE